MAVRMMDGVEGGTFTVFWIECPVNADSQSSISTHYASWLSSRFAVILIGAGFAYEYINRCGQNEIHFFWRESGIFRDDLDHLSLLFLIPCDGQQGLQPDMGINFEIF